MCGSCLPPNFCKVPCVPENLKPKTTFTHDAQNLSNQCGYDTRQVFYGDEHNVIKGGQSCVLLPKPHPCLSGANFLSCPYHDNTTTWLGGGYEWDENSKIAVNCEVCDGLTSNFGDQDSRQGFMQVDISWGPNAYNGVINELDVGIIAYGVYAIDQCGLRSPQALAKVAADGIPAGSTACCDNMRYWTRINYQLPWGVTAQTFMVVPEISLGPLDIGWVSAKIQDAYYVGSAGTLPSGAVRVSTKAQAEGNVLDMSDHGHDHDSEGNHVYDSEGQQIVYDSEGQQIVKEYPGAVNASMAQIQQQPAEEVEEEEEEEEEGEESDDVGMVVYIAILALVLLMGGAMLMRYKMKAKPELSSHEAHDDKVSTMPPKSYETKVDPQYVPEHDTSMSSHERVYAKSMSEDFMK